MTLKNAALQAAHERAQQDEAAFTAREAAAVQRRRVDKQNRAQMMGERERNRIRKLQAVGGREWDAEKKEEEDFGAGERGARARRGAHGAVVGGARQQQQQQEVEEAGDGASRRGFGERGRGRGRGRGGARGGRGDSANQQQKEHAQSKPQSPPTASDFPELPASAADKGAAAAEPPTKLAFPSAKPKENAAGPQPRTETPAVEKKVDGDKDAGGVRKWEEAKREFGLAALQLPGGETKSWADVESPT